jgi:hypothetical protein
MGKAINSWIEVSKDYWVNAVTKYVVRDWSSTMRKEWVILDNNGMMISCEWKTNRKICMREADNVALEESNFG